MLGLEVAAVTLVHSRSAKGVYGFNERDLAQLSAINDERVLGTLLSVPLSTMKVESAILRDDLLKRWLPLLTDRDTYVYSKTQKGNLVALLQSSKDEQALLIFRALELIGDRSQLFSLNLWKTNSFGKNAKPEVKKAYTSCLAAIEARAASSHSDSQLLRPSFPTDGADTYLRPVTQKVDENADTLLRAEIGGNDKEAQ